MAIKNNFKVEILAPIDVIKSCLEDIILKSNMATVHEQYAIGTEMDKDRATTNSMLLAKIDKHFETIEELCKKIKDIISVMEITEEE